MKKLIIMLLVILGSFASVNAQLFDDYGPEDYDAEGNLITTTTTTIFDLNIPETTTTIPEATTTTIGGGTTTTLEGATTTTTLEEATTTTTTLQGATTTTLAAQPNGNGAGFLAGILGKIGFYKSGYGYAMNKVRVIPYTNRVDVHISLRNTGENIENIDLKAYLIDKYGRVAGRPANSDVRLSTREIRREVLSLDKPEAGKYILIVEGNDDRVNGVVRKALKVNVR